MTPDELLKLIGAFGDACFDCGEWQEDSDPSEPYTTIFATQQAARQAVIEEIERLHVAFDGIVALHDANLRELEQAKAALEACQPWTPQLLKQYVTDTSDGFECLPACDSHGHEDLCPVTNVVQAFRLLRERLKQAKERLTICEIAHPGCSSRYLKDIESQLQEAKERERQLRAENTLLRVTIHAQNNPHTSVTNTALTVPPAKERA